MATDFRDAAGRFASSKFEGDKLLDAVSVSLLRAAKQEAPKKTGRLAESLHIEGSGDDRRITSEVPYMGMVLQGTRPHVIHARAGGVLAFPVGGQTVFARSVNHPGTAANDFFGAAIEGASAELQRAMEKAGEDFLAGLIP